MVMRPLLCRGHAILGMIIFRLLLYICNRAVPTIVIISLCYLILTVASLLFLGDVLDDYPDSPVGEGGLSREAASHLLDSEDAMETSSNIPSGSGSGSGASGSNKRMHDSNQRFQCPSEGRGPKIGPSLPPIYYSVLRKKLGTMTVRHLDGGACKDDDSTTLGASVNAHLQIGSFNNPNDKRHNHTVHRHGHQALRNISTSFDPVSFTCKTCTGCTRSSAGLWRAAMSALTTPLSLCSPIKTSLLWFRRGGMGSVLK